ncbi:hypothetical protein J437_LFUL002625, partial [Ladona fulva]
MAQKWHPDNFQGDEKKLAEKKFIDIAAAKEVLTDPEKRQRFDNGEDPLDPESGQGYGGAHGFNPFQHFHQFHQGGTIRDYQQALEIDSNYHRAKEGLQKAQKLQKQSERRDYYKILGVTRSASKKEITKAY